MKQSRYCLLILAIILFGAFLRFFMLTNQSLWFDEGWSLYYSGGTTLKDAIARLTQTTTSERFQPLYFVMLFFYRQAFGDSEFVLRSLSTILGIGAALVLFFATLRIYGERRALWSLVFFSFSSYVVYYSQEVRPYALLLLITSVQLLFFSEALHEDRPRNDTTWRWLFGISTGVGILGSIFLGLFSAALSLSHLLVYRDIRRWLKWWIPAGLLSLPAILFYIYSPVSNDPTYASVPRLAQPIVQNMIFVLYGILVGQSFGPPMEKLRGGDRIQVVFSYWPELLILFFVVAVIFLFLVLILRNRTETTEYKRADSLFVSLFAISYVFSFLFSFVTKLNWQPRHSFFLYFPIVIIISLVFGERDRYRTESRTVFRYAQVAVICLIILNMYSLVHYYFDKNYHRDDYRSVAQYLRANPSIPSVLLWGMPDLLKYYGATHVIDGGGLEKSNLSKQVKDITDDADTVLVAINREFYWGKIGSVNTYMENVYLMVDKISFPYFSIYTFVRKP